MIIFDYLYKATRYVHLLYKPRYTSYSEKYAKQKTMSLPAFAPALFYFSPSSSSSPFPSIHTPSHCLHPNNTNIWCGWMKMLRREEKCMASAGEHIFFMLRSPLTYLNSYPLHTLCLSMKVCAVCISTFSLLSSLSLSHYSGWVQYHNSQLRLLLVKYI